MPTFFTPLVDGQPNRAATFNEPLQEMETAILARAGTVTALQAWTTMVEDDTEIVIDVVVGSNTLELMLMLRTDRAGASDDAIRITINGDVANTYSVRYALIDAGVASAANSGLTGFQLDYAATGATASVITYGCARILISQASTAAAHGMNYESTAGDVVRFCVGSGIYPVASVITQLRIVPVNGTNFVAGSQYALYGMA
jgi:hypothetical protein